MLEIKDLHVYRGATHVLKGISLAVGEAETVALIGANGAGKTTTLQTISGLLKARSGEVRYRVDGSEHDLAAMRAEEIVRRGIVQCPEGRQVFASLTVEENLRVGAYTRSDEEGVRADLEQVHELFPILLERRRQSAGSLSGGEQMMLSMARALLARPRLLLLDEPSLGLAPQVVDTIFDVLERLRGEGVTLLLVEQNAQMALEVADRAYVLENGFVAHSGTGEELASNEGVRNAYLGIV